MKFFKLATLVLVAFLCGAGAAAFYFRSQCRRQLGFVDLASYGAALSMNTTIRDALQRNQVESAKTTAESEIARAVMAIVAVEDFERLASELGTLRAIKKSASYCREQKISIQPTELDAMFKEALNRIPAN